MECNHFYNFVVNGKGKSFLQYNPIVVWIYLQHKHEADPLVEPEILFSGQNKSPIWPAQISISKVVDQTCDKCVQPCLLNRVQLPSWRSSALRCPVERGLYNCQCSCPVHAIDEKTKTMLMMLMKPFRRLIV